MKQTLFMRQLSAYFETYLPEIRQNSHNTVSSYADSFALLFQFFHEKKGIGHHLIDYKHFTASLFDDFLFWLGNERNYSEASKRQRMSAISSFLKYASRRDIAALSAYSNSLNIETPKIPQAIFPFFTLPEIKILLRLPDPNKRLGSRDMVLLSLLYDTAARAQEICDLRVGNIKFGTPTKVRLSGKNKKTREIPVSDAASTLIRYYLKETGLSGTEHRDEFLFLSQKNEKMTPACIRNLTKKYVSLAKKASPDLFNESQYSPHSFRHSKAVHMVESGIALIYIRNFLGHTSVKTTERYARVSQSAVTKALTDRKIPNVAPEHRPQPDNSFQIPNFISSLR